MLHCSGFQTFSVLDLLEYATAHIECTLPLLPFFHSALYDPLLLSPISPPPKGTGVLLHKLGGHNPEFNYHCFIEISVMFLS